MDGRTTGVASAAQGHSKATGGPFVRGKRLIALAAAAAVLAGCSTSASTTKASSDSGGSSAKAADATPAKATSKAVPLRSSSVPTEYVGLTTQIPTDRASFDDIASKLFGDSAGKGSYLADLEVGSGLHLSSAAHPKAEGEVALTVALDTTGAEPPTRTVASVPASLTTGKVFIDSVDAAMAQTDKVRAEDPTGLAPWRIEYRSRSAQGGKVTVGVVFDPKLGTNLELQAQGPTTSLLPDRVNKAAAEGKPYETVYGLVWFDVRRDEFDFFSNRAYGISAGKSQNFKDFELVPHNWLRLTVTPELDQDRVSVGFDVVTVDGRRIPVAKAPASLIAGEQFMQTVFRMADNTAAQEKAKPGSSTPWQVPFYYDDPEGGGVVEVIAQGKDGKSQIAYSIESPANTLEDLPFVPYVGKIVVPEDWDQPPPSCKDLGSTKAKSGTFQITFQPSTTVSRSELKAPLTGTVYGSVYKAADVKITGPIDGTKPVASLKFAGVDTRKGPSKVYALSTKLPAGDYQILGFMDIDGNADPADPSPDEGDPVMIPIGGYEMACAQQPVTAEFAITLPPGIN